MTKFMRPFVRNSVRILCAACLVLVVAASRADDAPPPQRADGLAAALDAYDHRDPGAFTDTIPIEQAVLAAGAGRKVDDLLAASTHARFGALAFAVLCEHVAAPPEAKVLALWAGFPVERRTATAVTVAAIRTDGVRAALCAFAATKDVASDPQRAGAVAAAMLRAGDAAAVRSARDGLASTDVATVAATLTRIGDARATDFLQDLAALAADARKLPAPATSAWPEEKTTVSDDGATTTTQQVPVPIVTVGDAAVEAANRIGASPLPGFVAWWYEAEKGPRFGRGPAAVALLRAASAADQAATRAKAPRFAAAVAATVAAVRRGGEGRTWRLTGVAFDRTWSLRHEIDGTAGTSSVAADGSATLK